MNIWTVFNLVEKPKHWSYSLILKAFPLASQSVTTICHVLHDLMGSDCTHVQRESLIISSRYDHFLPTVISNKSVNGLHATVSHSVSLSSSKHVMATGLRRTRALCWGINMTALLCAAFWRPCSPGTAQQVSLPSLKQLFMTVSLETALLRANCTGRYDKLGWHSASGAVQTLSTRTGTLWRFIFPWTKSHPCFTSCTLYGHILTKWQRAVGATSSPHY